MAARVLEPDAGTCGVSRGSLTPSPAEEAVVPALTAKGYTVAHGLMTGLVADVPPHLLYRNDASTMPLEVARRWAPMYQSVDRGAAFKELFSSMDPAEYYAWASALGRPTVGKKIAAVKKAGLTATDVARWYAPLTLASMHRPQSMTKPSERLGSGWSGWLLNHYRAGLSPAEVLGWGWDAPSWLIAATLGRAGRLPLVTADPASLVVLAGADRLREQAPGPVAFWLASYAGTLPEPQRTWAMQALTTDAPWTDQARLVLGYSQVWSAEG